MRTNNRKFVLLAFALATFFTLRFTMGPRVHHGCCMQDHCGMHDERNAAQDVDPH